MDIHIALPSKNKQKQNNPPPLFPLHPTTPQNGFFSNPLPLLIPPHPKTFSSRSPNAYGICSSTISISLLMFFLLPSPPENRLPLGLGDLALGGEDSHGEGRPSQETKGRILVLRICRLRDISSISRKMLMTATTAKMATEREMMTASSGICESSCW